MWIVCAQLADEMSTDAIITIRVQILKSSHTPWIFAITQSVLLHSSVNERMKV